MLWNNEQSWEYFPSNLTWNILENIRKWDVISKDFEKWRNFDQRRSSEKKINNDCRNRGKIRKRKHETQKVRRPVYTIISKDQTAKILCLSSALYWSNLRNKNQHFSQQQQKTESSGQNPQIIPNTATIFQEEPQERKQNQYNQ